MSWQMAEFFTVSEVAEILHTNESKVRLLIKSGELKAHNFGIRATRISRNNLKKYIKQTEDK